MNGFLIRVLISSVLLLGHSVTASENNAMSLIKQLPSAWAESPVAFTNVVHKACDAIREIENPTNRLECAKEYAESLLNLNKFVRECDVQGYWARLNVLAMTKSLLGDLNIESKWRHTARYRQIMKDELKYYDARGSSTPMRIIRPYGLSKEEYEALVKENEKRRKALRYRSFANRIRADLRNRYKPIFEWGLREDCYNLSPDRKEALLKMVIEITGETPEWYRKELEGKK